MDEASRPVPVLEVGWMVASAGRVKEQTVGSVEGIYTPDTGEILRNAESKGKLPASRILNLLSPVSTLSFPRTSYERLRTVYMGKRLTGRQ